MYMGTVYHVLLLSWRAQATLHQLSCDLGRGTYHGRHVAGVAISVCTCMIKRKKGSTNCISHLLLSFPEHTS